MGQEKHAAEMVETAENNECKVITALLLNSKQLWLDLQLQI